MYYVVYGLLYTISLLPMRILYLFSDFIYFLLYSLAGYRKKVVFSNLTHAFPEKTEEERKKIAKKFYRNLADQFIETLKLFSAGNEFIRKRCDADFSVVNYLYDKGRKCQLHSEHNFNWEYANLALPLHIKHTPLTVYLPLENKIFDKIFKKIRSKNGVFLLPSPEIRKAIMPYRNTLYALILLADQSPGNPKNAYWIEFLNRPAPFLKGGESSARLETYPLYFLIF